MFPEKLRKRREELAMTQEELCARMGDDLSRQSVSKWECGEAVPELYKVLKLSVILGISVDALFADELAYLRKQKPADEEFKRKYPGLYEAARALSKALEQV